MTAAASSLRHQALHALRWAVLGHTHDRAAVEAAAVVLRTTPDELDPDERKIRADALELLEREVAGIDKPRPAREQAAALAALRAAELILTHTRPTDPLGNVIRRTA